MRHRICNMFTGMGNSEPVKLDNNVKLKNKKFWDCFLEDVMKNFKTMKEFKGFDFHLSENGFKFGIEPAYQYDDLQIIYFDFNNKDVCYLHQGRAFGFYGSRVVHTLKCYYEYKLKSKFIRFVDKWYEHIKTECKNILEEDK